MSIEHRSAAESGAVTSEARLADRRMVRAGVVAALACGVLTTVHEVWDRAIPGIQQGPGWALLHTSWLTAMFIAFLGISAVQRSGLDRFGRIATRVALVGTAAHTVAAAIEMVMLIAGTPSEGDPATPVLIAILTVFAVYVIGMILFAVAIMRAGVLPRSSGVVLLIALLLKMFASEVIPGTLALLGLAVAWVGVSAWRVARR